MSHGGIIHKKINKLVSNFTTRERFKLFYYRKGKVSHIPRDSDIVKKVLINIQ